MSAPADDDQLVVRQVKLGGRKYGISKINFRHFLHDRRWEGFDNANRLPFGHVDIFAVILDDIGLVDAFDLYVGLRKVLGSRSSTGGYFGRRIDSTQSFSRR